MIRTKPKIIRRGAIRDCVHYERIIGYIGTCILCGQVRDYSRCYDGDPAAKEKSEKGQEALQELRKAAARV